MLKNKFYIFLLLVFISEAVKANPGDTTWVQAQQGLLLNYYNNFDTAVAFPDGKVSYRKVIMIFTLGKYHCAPTAQYCGDWDYTIQNFLMTQTDTFELGRLITPYADSSYPRTGWGWQQRYYFDVTDYYPVLKDSAKIRLLYSGYSGGFTADIKFAFIEGTPPRNVLNIKPLWNGSFAYGKTTDPINNHLTAVTTVAPTGTNFTEMKFTATGHGSDGGNCAEFCSKYYRVYSKTSLLQQITLWRANCGSNELYPQSGTWVYNRANWCPGDLINPNIHKIPNVIADSNVNVSVQMQAYSNTGAASYTIASALFFYGAYNQTLDASLEGIVSPTNYEGNYRENPICGSPVIDVKNTGATTINSIQILYGVQGQALQTYNLTGMKLASMLDTLITLPDLTPITTMVASNMSTFIAIIQQVNGVNDPYPINDTMTSTFVTAPDWPNQFVMHLRSNTNPSLPKWQIQDLSGNIIIQRSAVTVSTSYVDSVKNLAPGCYKLVVTTTGTTGCVGLSWWGNSYGAGYIYAATPTGTVLHMTNGLPDYPDGVSQDFGCGFNQFFRVGALMPVNLLSFSGKGEENNNHLFWETAEEINVNHFELEFSGDGIQFNKVADIKAVGNSTVKSMYSYIHNPSVLKPVYYYRLKMVDNNGQFKYSNMVTIKSTTGNFSITNINPNPFVNLIDLNITALKAQPVMVNIYDVQGRIQLQKNVELQSGINQIELIGLDKFVSGIYLLEISAEGQRIVQKIMKK